MAGQVTNYKRRPGLVRIFWAFNVVCFLLVYPPIIFLFNKPASVMGLPLVYVWTTLIGLVWMVGAFVLGFMAEGYL
jgi:hypothetical protein